MAPATFLSADPFYGRMTFFVVTVSVGSGCVLYVATLYVRDMRFFVFRMVALTIAQQRARPVFFPDSK